MITYAGLGPIAVIAHQASLLITVPISLICQKIMSYTKPIHRHELYLVLFNRPPKEFEKLVNAQLPECKTLIPEVLKTLNF